jgi:TetR/AcrR family transcriptional regulator
METKQLLLDRALELFAAHGYESVGVQQIVEAAGVTKPTLYHHFGSKAGLLRALLGQQCEPYFAALEAACVYRGDLPQTLFLAARAMLGFARKSPEFYRLRLALRFSASASEAYGSIEPFLARQQRTLEDLFTLVVADHGNLRGRHSIFAVTFAATVDAYIATGEASKALQDDAMRQAVKQFMYGIYAM